jgi:hypothetical protein
MSLIEAMSNRELISFSRKFKRIKDRYEKNSYLWSGNFLSLTPVSFALHCLIFLPAIALFVMLGNFEAAMCLAFLLLFYYLLGYLPYYKEVPSYKKIKAHYAFFLAQRDLYDKYLEDGIRLAQNAELCFSKKGFFYTPDKKYRLQAFDGRFVNYYE